jgi:hypothetical protein
MTTSSQSIERRSSWIGMPFIQSIRRIAEDANARLFSLQLLGTLSMPLKLSVGISRKTGEPNFGSRGATVGLEVEANVCLVRNPERLQQHLAYLFRLAQQSLDQQLSSDVTAVNGNSHTPDRPATTQSRPATSRQRRAIRAIASRLELDLASRLNDRYGVDRPDALSVSQASELIDALNSSGNGEYMGSVT